MDEEQRRRQIEDEMARFEQEIFQVQQALPPPPAPPAVMFIPSQMQRAPPMQPPPIPQMLIPSRVASSMMSGMDGMSQMSSGPATISAPPVKVYSAPPRRTSDMEQDDILSALRRAEAEIKEAKKNPIVIQEKIYIPPKPTPVVVPTPSSSHSSSHSNREDKKPKKLIRMAGQQVWEDTSLAEWDNDDFRIFCGDLGNDVSDEMLTRVFSKYPSFVKAKVIRDKRTNKSKGYGFISFKEPQGFIKAMRELNGKYVGSRPIKLRKSTWNERNIDVVKKKVKEKQKLGLL